MAKRGRKPKQIAETPMTEEQKLISDIRDIINEPSQRNPEKLVEEVLDREEKNSINQEPIEEEEELAEPDKRDRKQIALIAVKKEYVGEIISLFMNSEINAEIEITKSAELPDAVLSVYEYV